jgi:hypothetical protein
MNATIESSLYYLFVQGRDENAIFVFLGTDPSSEREGVPECAPVTLVLLPPRERFGGAGGIAMGLPVLGRWPGSIARFRQFLNTFEMEQAGWVPVTRYRICDCWEDYNSPWSFGTEDLSTGRDSMSRTAADDLNDTDSVTRTPHVNEHPVPRIGAKGSVAVS